MNTDTPQPRWNAYLGITAQGKVVPYIVEGTLNPLGSRFEKEKPFPGSVYPAFQKEMSPEEMQTCLIELQAWLDSSPNFNNPKKKKK